MNILDILLIAVLALIVFISYKRGFILTVFDLVSGVVACFLAKMISPSVASFVYDNGVRKIVLDFLQQKFEDAETSLALTMSDITSSFGFLPENVLNYAESSGLLDFESLSENIISGITTVDMLEAEIVGPAVVSVLNLICFSILSFILLIVLRIAAVFVSKLITVTKLGEKLNSGLGAFFGLLKGVVYVFIIAIVLTVAAYFSESIAEYASLSYICTFAKNLLGL